MKIYSEKYLERKLREGVKELGSLALKFQSTSFTGLPDRLILLPSNQVIWVELKSSDKTLSLEQQKRAALLRRMGQSVCVVDDADSLNRVLKITKQKIDKYEEK